MFEKRHIRKSIVSRVRSLAIFTSSFIILHSWPLAAVGSCNTAESLTLVALLARPSPRYSPFRAAACCSAARSRSRRRCIRYTPLASHQSATTLERSTSPGARNLRGTHAASPGPHPSRYQPLPAVTNRYPSPQAAHVGEQAHAGARHRARPACAAHLSYRAGGASAARSSAALPPKPYLPRDAACPISTG